MNLIFRMLWVVIRSFVTPKPADMTQIHRLRLKVFPNDLDTNFHVNNGRYLTLLDLGRLDLLLRAGLFFPFVRRGWKPVVASVSLRFKRSLKIFETFEIQTRLVSWDKTWLYFEQKMLVENKLACHILIKGVILGPKGKIPSEVLIKMAKIKSSAEELPEHFSKWLESEELWRRTELRQA